jgi:LuxR family transcriptional regulator, maltose regulon positive regulatory protein
VAAELVARARQGWPVPPWLDQRLTLIESRTHAAAGDALAAVAAATRAGREVPLEAAVVLAEAWVLAGDRIEARRALTPALAALHAVPERTRLQAWLADARLKYASGDPVRGRRSLESALRLGEQEQLRLPFAMARTWLRLVLWRDPALAHAHRQLLEPGLISPPGWGPAHQVPSAGAEPALITHLSEREREVLRNVARMLSSAEVATEMYISVNTVKTHLKSIYRKLDAVNRRDAVRRARQLELI